MNDRRVREYVKRLRRRINFLEKRVNENQYENSHYDRAELLALKWAVHYIEDTPVEAADHNGKWYINKEAISEI